MKITIDLPDYQPGEEIKFTLNKPINICIERPVVDVAGPDEVWREIRHTGEMVIRVSGMVAP